jgi:hypothetical protein
MPQVRPTDISEKTFSLSKQSLQRIGVKKSLICILAFDGNIEFWLVLSFNNALPG